MRWHEFLFFIRHHASDDIAKIERAFAMSESAHALQKRKSGEPYFTHPTAVATMLAEYGADADTICAALLHDTVEDTELTLEEISLAFGEDVATLVEGVTKLTEEELEDHPSQNEQVETLRKMFTLMQHDVRIMVIKLVDRLHNMQTAAFLSEHSRMALARETLDVYVKIADRLCMQDIRDELEGLCRSTLNPDGFHALRSVQQSTLVDGTAVLITMRRRIEGSASAPMLEHITLHFEHKQWDQLQSLMETEGVAMTGNASVTAAIVCDSLDVCYQMLGVLHQFWPRENMSFQDFINIPAINGYRGLHTTVILPGGMRVRCKIRTVDMHEYARKGITTLCFSSRAKDIATYLPWIKSINPLSDSTTGRSDDFWESLKSDILGESMIIHGPADETVAIPKQSTALDAAFYLFGEQALCLTYIQVNGKSVAFDSLLTHAATIGVSMSDIQTVRREWLQWCNTSLATSIIRTSIASMSSPKKNIQIGRSLLQKIMTERRRGFIEEFNEDLFLKAFQKEGFLSCDEGYAAIAEGRLSAEDLYASLFENRTLSSLFSRFEHSFRLHFSFSAKESQDFTALMQSYSTAELHPRSIRFRYDPKRHAGQCTMTIATRDHDQLRTISESIRKAGGTQVSVESYFTFYTRYACLVLLTILWGLDPVFVKKILSSTAIEPLDFTIVRNVIFFLTSLIVYCGQRKISKRFRKISWKDGLLWAGSTMLFMTGMMTYFSLQSLSPLEYITLLYASVILMPLINPFGRRPFGKKYLLAGALLALLSIVIMVLAGTSHSWLSFVYGTAASLSFAFFTVFMDEYKRRHHIAMRVPQLLFAVSVLSLCITLPLLPLSALSSLSPIELSLIVLYSLVMVALPYHMYYQLLRTRIFQSFTTYFFVGSMLTVMAEFLLLGSLHAASILSLSVMCLAVWIMNVEYQPYVTSLERQEE